MHIKRYCSLCFSFRSIARNRTLTIHGWKIYCQPWSVVSHAKKIINCRYNSTQAANTIKQFILPCYRWYHTSINEWNIFHMELCIWMAHVIVWLSPNRRWSWPKYAQLNQLPATFSTTRYHSVLFMQWKINNTTDDVGWINAFRTF